MNWLDWVLLSILVFSAIRGLQTGLFASLTRVFGSALGIAISYAGYRPLANYLNEQWGCGELAAEIIRQRIPEQLQRAELAEQQLFGGFSVQALIDQLALNMLEVISFMALVVLVGLVMRRVIKFFSKTIARSFLGPLDRIGGLIVGLVRGGLVLLVIALISEPLQAVGLAVGQETAEGALYNVLSTSQILPVVLSIMDLLSLHLPS